MSLVQARADLVTAVEAVRAAYVTATGQPLLVDYDNRDSVSQHEQHETWLDVNVKFVDAYQGDLNRKPFHRHIGVLVLEANTKEGLGSAKNLALLDFFYTRLHGRTHGIVRTLLTDMRPDRKADGWYKSNVGVPFWFDVVVNIP